MNIITLIFFLVALTSRIILEIIPEIVRKTGIYEMYNNIAIYFVIALFISLIILYLIRNTKLVSYKIVYAVILVILLGMLVTNDKCPYEYNDAQIEYSQLIYFN